MPNYDLRTPLEVARAAKIAGERAALEKNQREYNAAWLHGYASGLRDVAQQQQIYSRDNSHLAVLKDILALAQAELNQNGSIGFTMPDGRHHIYISVDDSFSWAQENTTPEDYYYVIEPNRVVDGAHEPMGDTYAADYNNFGEVMLGCVWCLEQFENDPSLEKVTAKVFDGPLTKEDLILDDNDELYVDDVVFGRVEGYLWATDALVFRMKEVVGKELSSEALSTVENINFYPVYDLRTNEAHIEGTYWYFDGQVNAFGEFRLELNPEEQTVLITAMEHLCNEKYQQSCLELLNEVRKAAGFKPTESLDEKIKAAQAKAEETPGSGSPAASKKGPELS